MNQFVEAFRFIGRNGQIPGEPPFPTLVHLALETLKIAGIGVAIAVAIGLPIGLWLGHKHRGSFVAINLGNLWRALPSLAVLAIGVAFLGLGLRNVELALIVLAVPPIITNAYVAIDGVDRITHACTRAIPTRRSAWARPASPVLLMPARRVRRLLWIRSAAPMTF